MKCHWMRLLLLLTLFLAPCTYAAEKAILLDVSGTISPATQDYVQRGIAYAQKQGAAAVILKVNTSGGLESAIRAINESIVTSPIPIIAYIPPAAHAHHGGTFIMYASHLAAMAPGTEIGTAAPESLGDAPATNINSFQGEKRIEEAAAYMHSLATLRGRNADWADLSVRHSVNISAEEAKRLKVIDEVAANYPQLLDKLTGHTVLVLGTSETLNVKNVVIENRPLDLRYQFINFITNPNIVYLLLLIAIYGLFFELSNPGLILPGIIGMLSLLLTLYTFQLTPINYTGLTLLLIGIVLMIFEVYISSVGISGIGGVLAFILGSLLLFDVSQPHFHLALILIIAMSLISITFFYMQFSFAVRARKRALITSKEGVLGRNGIVLSVMNKQVVVSILDEIWQAQSAHLLIPGQKITVTHIDGLILTVVPANEERNKEAG